MNILPLWPEVPLKKVLTYLDERVELKDTTEYITITVKRRHGGLEERERLFGHQIKTKKQFRLIPGAFIISRVQCWHQAFALVPDSLPPNMIASTNYDQFAISPEADHHYFWWFSHSPMFTETVRSSASGVVIEKMVFDREAWLEKIIPLPPRSVQRRIVAKIEELAEKIKEASSVKKSIADGLNQLLLSIFNNLVSGAEFQPMSEVAPITRRPVKINVNSEYPELGVRSFGKGTFHKPFLNGLEVGTKKLFCIEPGDLVFNNVFAWEGAVAVAKQEDDGRVGSHRFISCVPKRGVATPNFLCFYFLTKEGLAKLGEASPGGAGRNRTLGLEALTKITVPLPPIEKQLWFDKLQMMTNSLKSVQTETQKELNALMPSILDKAFKGDL